MAEKSSYNRQNCYTSSFLISESQLFFPNIYHGQSFALVKLKS
ncbi:hypothetical protein Thiosp_02242 [Thiorhodovibrio litoralis]|nr:hypothetical protein Thiosp_02242 [Thiorhodovibrio litoralis]